MSRSSTCTSRTGNSSTACSDSQHVSQADHANQCLTRMVADEDKVIETQIMCRSQETSASTAAIVVWRERVSQWCYRVIDHVKADRSTIYNVMTLLDRYVAQLTASDVNYQIQADAYQVMAMAALYLVLRLRERGIAHRLTVAQMVQMSRGSDVVTADRIAHTMKSMVQSLSDWRDICFAPSPGEFVVAYVEQLMATEVSIPASSLASSASSNRIEDLLQASKWSSTLDDATYLAELSVCDSQLSDERPSVIAYAAILNVMGNNKMSASLKEDLHTLQRVTGYTATSRNVRDIYARIAYVHTQSSDYASNNAAASSSSSLSQPTVIPQDDECSVTTERPQEHNIIQTTSPQAAEANDSATAIAAGMTKGPINTISAVISYEDVSAVVDDSLSALPASQIPSDSDDEGPIKSGMKRVRNYSSCLSKRAKLSYH